MSDYPSAIYSPRTKENRAGVVYDAGKTTIGYAEDIVYLDGEVVAIETELGATPKNTSASVAERLKGIRSLSDSNSDVIVIKGGDIGIGTSTPSTKLHILSTSNTIRIGYDATKYGDLTTDSSGNNLWHATGFVQIHGDNVHGDMTGEDSNDFKILGTPSGSAGKGLYLKGFSASPFGWVDGLRYLNVSSGKPDMLLVPVGGNVGINTASPTAVLDITSDIIRLRTSKTPASAGASGNAGDICWDSSYIYICTATNTWKRVAIATW